MIPGINLSIMYLLPSLSIILEVINDPKAFMNANGRFKIIPVVGAFGSSPPIYIPELKIIVGP